MTSVAIYQNYYLPEQKAYLDEQLIPYDGTKNHPLYYEMGPTIELYKSGQYQAAEYVGMVSWKFARKTKISGKQFIDFIQCNPGYDVYLINPFPKLRYFYFNVWEQEEVCYPAYYDVAEPRFRFEVSHIFGEQIQAVCENQSVFVPQTVKHRMENPGKLPLVLIEVQSGNYLGEDDIVRFEDV